MIFYSKKLYFLGSIAFLLCSMLSEYQNKGNELLDRVMSEVKGQIGE